MARPSRLMPPAEVAAYHGVEVTAVRSLMRTYDVPFEAGYDRHKVEAIERRGQGYRTDLERKRPRRRKSKPAPTTDPEETAMTEPAREVVHCDQCDCPTVHVNGQCRSWH